MGSIRVRHDTGKLFFDFRFNGRRCRELTLLDDTKANRAKMEAIMAKIEEKIRDGSFVYEEFFPNSKAPLKMEKDVGVTVKKQAPLKDTPLFEDFAQEWFEENEVGWKQSYRKTIRGTLDKYLIPAFGEKEVGSITRGEILKFRSSLAKVPNGKKQGLSPDRINHIMTPLRMILDEAADRYDFSTPFVRIKPLKVPPSDVDPFSIEEVKAILNTVREDFRPYYTVRFFTGMRTGEIDGLKWEYVDFEHRIIRVRETLVDGREETPKTAGSIRDIWMSQLVYDALMLQRERTGHFRKFVFCTRNGEPFDHRNVTKRVWYPLLRYLGLKKRKPYQTRHTAATLWLAAGENPEWIARQMGHTTTRMLFTVYSRFVPNLTRRDGSAFERLLVSNLGGGDYEPNSIND
ncbi:MAG: site-specific integrase [Gammaproteobacteria bacterium]|nr:MAG: site-specific integrase [Gammaproteobacteria bacterium]